MKVTIEEAVWTVSRQPPPAGWRAEGEQLQPQESGLWFHCDRGEARFITLDSAQLPTQAQLEATPLEQLVTLWKRASRR